MYECEPLPWRDRLREPTKSDAVAEYARQQGVPVVDIPLSAVGIDVSALYTPLDEHRLGKFRLRTPCVIVKLARP